MSNDLDLSLATTGQLFAALCERFEAVALVVESKPVGTSTDETDTKWFYHGGLSRSLGMMHRAMQNGLAARIIPKDDENDE